MTTYERIVTLEFMTGDARTSEGRAGHTLKAVARALDAGNAVRQQLGTIPSVEEVQPGKALLLLGVFGASIWASRRKTATREQIRKLSNLLDEFTTQLDEAARQTGDTVLVESANGIVGSGSALWEMEMTVGDLQPIVNRATGRLLEIQTQLFLRRG